MNLAEVAKKARVSPATVSRVLNDAAPVRAATRERVMKAVKELRYHPNLHARNLAVSSSRTLGMIASNMENPFFFDIFRKLESEAHRRGYEVLVANTDYRSDQLVNSIRLMLGRRVAGLAVIVSEMQPALIDELADSKVPVVFADVGTPRANITNIRVNYTAGVEKVVEYLHSLGHYRMAFIDHHGTLTPISERKRAFLNAVARYSPAVEIQTAAGADGPEGGREATQDLLRGGFRPTAIICVNDFMAIGILRELRVQRMRVPLDVSVTGFDNIKLSEFCYPSLTTVHIPRDRFGQLVFDILVPDPRKPRAAGCEIVIDPELVVRDSTGPAPKL